MTFPAKAFIPSGILHNIDLTSIDLGPYKLVPCFMESYTAGSQLNFENCCQSIDDFLFVGAANGQPTANKIDIALGAFGGRIEICQNSGPHLNNGVWWYYYRDVLYGYWGYSYTNYGSFGFAPNSYVVNANTNGMDDVGIWYNDIYGNSYDDRLR